MFEADLADPLPYAHHAFFAEGAGAARPRPASGRVRRASHRIAPRAAEQWFTVHYAVLARRP